MKVVSVNISEVKGTRKHPVDEIEVNTQGVVGDAHAAHWHRQVSVLSEELIHDFEAETGRKTGPGEFAENITTSGLDLRTVGALDRLLIGDVNLEVTQIGKECHGDTCAIFKEVGRCVMPKEGIFARVAHGGKITPGASIEHVARPLRIRIITASDRAARCEYTDRSGPRIQELLADFFTDKRWHPQYETALVPDDTALIRNELTLARDEAVDVVFTTGGTGIGPRDVTPDVASELIEKKIPGIMEHIRMKFGARKPNALLSRGVAGTMKRALVYTLPGSVRAVEEYVGEIVLTLEHLICTVHGLDTH